MTPTMNFTMEEENDNKINFLHITISKEDKNVSFNIYRKPTTTDTIIPSDSCHPSEHKLAAIRPLTNRLTTYTMNNTDTEKEKNTIKQTLYNNKYDTPLLNKFIPIENKKGQKKIN
jgi:formamidopyrimidine-DNA glycosylase